ncbi:Aryl-phospho-beta-D-glucosidase BglC, GH1 family [Pedobacter suwonensis]|uniref:Aryl-phospho-beta-D-glucosidase BglC, GH1 family n=1 Tax=Pedobacter suwonensis TaxID=332999 RepID=A0A1I0SNK5_9SPHI|nr:cellulase family glycosylhydrolase [Pedobacter suwonensis]SFA41013.1 Aryl-phospho-beta-D-glucosidase BglC, GH1 family [Pedobacter suwonensis]
MIHFRSLKINGWLSIILLLAITFITTSCKKKEDVQPQLNVSISAVAFQPNGGVSNVTINSNAKWSTKNPADSWLKLNQMTGSEGNTELKLTATPNTTGISRSAVMIVTADNGQARRLTISQTSYLFPSYNTSPKAPDQTGMNSTAVQLAAKMKLGWNIGNTMESPGSESGWGNPQITESYVKFLKQTGFNAVRLPCSWDWHHLSDRQKATIDPAWLNRVKEVVKYCVDNDMYVLLNIHWDGGWLDQNINAAKKDSVNAKQKAYWEQIATTMRDFDEHLMFASANEPPAENAEQMAILNEYHQTFINSVRSTGGKNSYRVLVVQGPGTDPDKTNNLMNSLPTDQVPNRLMVEVHNYSPSQFTILDNDATWGKMFYYWGTGYHSTIQPDRNPTWGEESEHIRMFTLMKAKFIDKGIPVILGEYGAYKRGNTRNVPLDLPTHNASVDYWNNYVTRQAIQFGLKPFFWDTGGALDRRNNTVLDQGTINALISAGK